MFAGSFRGVTQTVPLAIYERFSTDFTGALGALGRARVRVGGAAARGQAGVPCCGLRSQTARAGLDVALDVPDGGCLALAGPVGRGQDDRAAGRSRGCSRPSAASSRAATTTWLDTARGIDLRPERRRCGYVFQDYALFGHLSAWRNVAYGIDGGDRRARAHALLERFGLTARADAKPARAVAAASASGSRSRARSRGSPRSCCSTSRCRRWTRARAPPPRASWPRVLRDTGVPALLVTHDFAEAALLGDRVGVIDQRRDRAARPGRGALRRPGVRVRRRLHRRRRADRRSPRPAATG